MGFLTTENGWSVRSRAVLAMVLLAGLGGPSPARLAVSPLSTQTAAAAESPFREPYDYAPAMMPVTQRFKGRVGVVIHIGDSITYASPYSAWARYGEGKTDADKAALAWMHAGADNDRDGWWLCRVDLPGGRSHTACSGIRLDQMLAGGKSGMPPLADLLDKYQPQLAVVMLGTNDASAGRPVESFRRDLNTAIELFLARGIVPLLSTIPPHIQRRELAREYSSAIRDTAREKLLPLIDFEREILSRRADDWDGTLLNRGDVHPTAENGGVTAASAPTPENLRNCGYLLRGWLSVRKIAEVKRSVLDAANAVPAKPQAVPAVPSARVPIDGLVLPVTRDLWLSNVGDEANGNNGGAPSWKLKSNQEMTLFDIDPKPLQGRIVRAATLHLKPKGTAVALRGTVGSVGAEWFEGTGRDYEPQVGASTFRARRHPDLPWTVPGSDLCSVIFGQGGSEWGTADASPPDSGGWQRLAIAPRVVAARVAGLSYGFLAFDDTGSEWTRDGERFTLHHFPNRFFHSREADAANAPYLTVLFGEPDRDPPGRPGNPVIDAADLPAGQAWLSWTTPTDNGPAGTLGFSVRIDGQEAPRYLVPLAGPAGSRVLMRLRDWPFANTTAATTANTDATKAGATKAGATKTSASNMDASSTGATQTPATSVAVSVRAIDAAGNVGEPLEFRAKLSTRVAAPLPPQPTTAPAAKLSAPASLPRIGEATVAVIDELDKVQPITGGMIPAMEPAEATRYLASNHLWNASDRTVRLTAAGNEFLAFQLLFGGPVRDVRVSLRIPSIPDIKVSVGRYWHVKTARGPLPDPIVPLAGSFSVPAADEGLDGQRTGSLHVELYVPRNSPAGEHLGQLELRSAGNAVLTLPVKLQVWNFALPDQLSFLAEMNCYALPANERDYYRLAHRHRTVLNRVPYSQSGRLADGCGPEWDGKGFSWEAWDQRFGPYLDGSAFADLPRAGVPIECFYLPLNENWPFAMESNYNGDYWADRAFPPSYRAGFVDASRQFAEHLDAKGWRRTLFHFFLNGKNNFKERGWSRGSSPWLLDEPSNFQDYWALAWYGEAFHEGVRAARAGVNAGSASRAETSSAGGPQRGPGIRPAAPFAHLLFRADVSRPQWQRTSFDGLLDYNVVGGAFREYTRMVLDRKQAFRELAIEYGGTNAVTDGNVQALGWCLDAWSLGADGVVPWQTVGNDASWKQADELSLFYPARPGSDTQEPVPSVRLKAYRRGQQDVEYLTMWADSQRQPRWAAGQRVREALGLRGTRSASGFVGGEDAGLIHYSQLRTAAVTELRSRIGTALSAAPPASSPGGGPAGVGSTLFSPRPLRNPAPIVNTFVVDESSMGTSLGGAGTSGAPTARPATTRPAAPTKPTGPRVVTLAGRDAVRDTLIDFEQPEKAFGAVPRDNAVRKALRSTAFLVHFELAKANLPPGAKIKRARVEFFVWDPSGRGVTKLAAVPVLTEWDEATATWNQPAAGKRWRGGAQFALDKDAGPAENFVIIKPDDGADTVEPPAAYSVDVTAMTRGWLAGMTPNAGVALVPIPDRAIDEGNYTRFQVCATEYSRAAYTPRLVLEYESP
jgi:hypothetical protein